MLISCNLVVFPPQLNTYLFSNNPDEANRSSDCTAIRRSAVGAGIPAGVREVMAVDDTGTDETVVLMAVEGKRLNADNILNSYVITYTGEKI